MKHAASGKRFKWNGRRWQKASLMGREHVGCHLRVVSKGGYTLVTLSRIVKPYRDSVDETRERVTYQKLVTR